MKEVRRMSELMKELDRLDEQVKQVKRDSESSIIGSLCGFIFVSVFAFWAFLVFFVEI